MQLHKSKDLARKKKQQKKSWIIIIIWISKKSSWNLTKVLSRLQTTMSNKQTQSHKLSQWEVFIVIIHTDTFYTVYAYANAMFPAYGARGGLVGAVAPAKKRKTSSIKLGFFFSYE